jgi:cell wall-associated NlpC family hydrolase
VKKQPRLQLTHEEREAPALKKPIQRADRAAAKADAAQAKLPHKTQKARERVLDPATGQKKVQLRFEETITKPPSKLAHHIQNAPARLALGRLHSEVRQAEDDNVGVESAHQSEQAAETGAHLVQEGYRSHKLKPYRKAAQAEHRLEKANVNALYQKSLQENPQLASNPFSRWQQKQAIKKQYAAALHTGQAAGSAAAKSATGKTAAEGSKKITEFFARHKKGLAIVAAVLMLMAMMVNLLSSCSVILSGVGSSVVGSTYPAQDGEMLGAEAAYAAMESDLQNELDHYATFHPAYDEYHFDLDEIGHDPYVLISLITALHEGEWTLTEVQGTLEQLLDRQYLLTQRVEVEQRTRPVPLPPPEVGTTDETYDYSICYVTLENFDLSHLPVYLLTEQQLSVYDTYMATLGNRPDLFPQGVYPNAHQLTEYTDYDIPPEALENERFAAMIEEAEKYLGYPYVWGGSNPATSFDCSGFVSWVLNHSGWSIGRMDAQSLFDYCTPVSGGNLQPGDLMFFQGTYKTTKTVTHVGIYVGNNKMLHCGNPISYTDLNWSFWQEHFYAYGRLPR